MWSVRKAKDDHEREAGRQVCKDAKSKVPSCIPAARQLPWTTSVYFTDDTNNTKYVRIPDLTSAGTRNASVHVSVPVRVPALQTFEYLRVSETHSVSVFLFSPSSGLVSACLGSSHLIFFVKPHQAKG